VDVDRPEELLSGRKVPSSNTHTLIALVRQAGGLPVNLGIAHDTPESLRQHLRPVSDCDLLVTTAGLSVGEHDYVKAVLQELGAEIRFWKLRMRPGAPVGFGVLRLAGQSAGAQALPWIGLPGNPVSTMVTFELFVRPAIRQMVGQRQPFRATRRVRVADAIKLGPKLQHFLRAVVTDGEARLTGPQGSGILTSMAQANALLIIPEGQHETAAGSEADVLMLDETQHTGQPGF
jgi:molybdopterin molybdotransferase